MGSGSFPTSGFGRGGSGPGGFGAAVDVGGWPDRGGFNGGSRGGQDGSSSFGKGKSGRGGQDASGGIERGKGKKGRYKSDQ